MALSSIRIGSGPGRGVHLKVSFNWDTKPL
jgi:hypothetical protein